MIEKRWSWHGVPRHCIPRRHALLHCLETQCHHLQSRSRRLQSPDLQQGMKRNKCAEKTRTNSHKAHIIKVSPLMTDLDKQNADQAADCHMLDLCGRTKKNFVNLRQRRQSVFPSCPNWLLTVLVLACPATRTKGLMASQR